MSDTVARVLKKGTEAALLTARAGNVTFRYTEHYLAGDGPAIASTLPKSADIDEFTRGATPPFFSGLLPEGRRLQAVAARLKTSVDNEVALLIDIGNDLIGDVQVLPLKGKETRAPVLLPHDLKGVSFVRLREEVFGSPASGLPGVQDKVSSAMQNAPVTQAERHFMLKLNPPSYSWVVENEHFFLGVAKASGLRVSPHRLLTDSEGEHALLIERFDRPGEDPKSWLAVEDGAQALGVYPAAKYDLSMKEVCGGLIRLCSAPPVAAYEIFQQVVFSYLVGNGDAHAKNFSVVEDPQGGYRLSPAYDIVNTLFYGDRTTALAISGKQSNLDRGDILAFARTIGLTDRAATRALDGLLRKLADLGRETLDLSSLPFHASLRRDVAGRMRKRWEKLSGSD